MIVQILISNFIGKFTTLNELFQILLWIVLFYNNVKLKRKIQATLMMIAFDILQISPENSRISIDMEQLLRGKIVFQKQLLFYAASILKTKSIISPSLVVINYLKRRCTFSIWFPRAFV